MSHVWTWVRVSKQLPRVWCVSACLQLSFKCKGMHISGPARAQVKSNWGSAVPQYSQFWLYLIIQNKTSRHAAAPWQQNDQSLMQQVCTRLWSLLGNFSPLTVCFYGNQELISRFQQAHFGGETRHLLRTDIYERKLAVLSHPAKNHLCARY